MQAVLHGIDQRVQLRVLEADPFQTGIDEQAHRRDKEPHGERGPHDMPERWLRPKH